MEISHFVLLKIIPKQPTEPKIIILFICLHISINVGLVDTY